jgi:hypothetical protein
VRAPRAVRLWQILIVLVGLGFGWLLLAIQQYVWDEATNGRLPYLPDSWLPIYERIYQRLGARRGLSAYYFWGRFAGVLYLAVLVGAWGLPGGLRRSTGAYRIALLGATAVAGIGDLISYWGGRNGEMSSLTGIGFGLVESPGLLLMLASMVAYGVSLVRERVKPTYAAWSLICGAILAVLVAFPLLAYVPHALLVVILATLLVALTGYYFLGEGTSSSRRARASR